VVEVDFRWSMPVPLVNRVPTDHLVYRYFLSATCSLRWCGSADQYAGPSSSLLVLGLAGFNSMCRCYGTAPSSLVHTEFDRLTSRVQSEKIDCCNITC